MRISDWCSDVCSSDLHAAAAGLDDHVGHPRIPAIVAVGAALGKVRVAGRKAQFHPVGDDRDAVERRTERVDEADGRDLEAGAGVRDIIIRVESVAGLALAREHPRSEEHTSELQTLMRISYAV